MLAHGALGLHILSLLLQLFALVVKTSSPPDPKKHLRVPFPEVDLEGDLGEALFPGFDLQATDLLAVQEQLAHTIGFLVGPVRLFVG